MSFFRKFGRFMLGFTYAAMPFVGWYWLAKSFKRVNPGEISILKNNNGSAEILYAGLHFRPFPGDEFGKNYNMSNPFIDMGPIKRVTIQSGFKGVKYVNGKAIELSEGIHFIDETKNETIRQNDIVDISRAQFNLGPKKVVTIPTGHIAGIYRQGEFQTLEGGKRYELEQTDEFIPAISLDHKDPQGRSIVPLGPLSIITVNEGYVGIVNGDKGVEILGPGVHNILRSENKKFSHFLSRATEVVDLEPLDIISTDKLQMRTKAILSYRVEDPKKAATRVEHLETAIKDLAETTLASILRRFSLADISPALQHEKNNGKEEESDSHLRIKKLKEIHDEFINELKVAVEDWGVKVNDLKIKTIEPADSALKQSISQLGTKKATIDAERELAKYEGEIAITKNKVENDKQLMNAKTKQETEVMNAETGRKVKIIEAESQQQSEITVAKGQAEALNLKNKAETEGIKMKGDILNQLTKQTQQYFLNQQYADAIKGNPNAVLVQPDIGQTNHWRDQHGKNVTFFRTHGNQHTRHSNVMDALDLQTTTSLMNLPKQVAT